MTYTINKSDGTVLATVAEATINTTASSVSLVGRRAVAYGESFAENFVKLTENFAHTSAPTAPMTGQLWFDKSINSLKLYSGGDWAILATVAGTESTISGSQLISTAPSGTAPIVVSSTTKVVNLNADLVDGFTTSLTATPTTIAVRDSNADLYANEFRGTAVSAKYADVAERFSTSETVHPGDIVEIGGHAEIQKARGYATESVLGVVSTDPAFRMNEHAGDDASHPFVAFAGRVPCKVTGQAFKGDRLVTSEINGVAIVDNDAPIKAIIGRVLEDKRDLGVREVLIVVGAK